MKDKFRYRNATKIKNNAVKYMLEPNLSLTTLKNHQNFLEYCLPIPHICYFQRQLSVEKLRIHHFIYLNFLQIIVAES